jgi:hypothetical protein
MKVLTFLAPQPVQRATGGPGGKAGYTQRRQCRQPQVIATGSNSSSLRKAAPFVPSVAQYTAEGHPSLVHKNAPLNPALLTYPHVAQSKSCSWSESCSPPRVSSAVEASPMAANVLDTHRKNVPRNPTQGKVGESSREVGCGQHVDSRRALRPAA